MTKPRFETPDLTAANIDKIAALFPSVITEAPDEEKSTPERKVYKKAVNFEALKTLLGNDISGSETYEFTWVSKKASVIEANKPIRKTLRPCKEESRDWDTTQNLYIEGDNLEVLKLLQESYLGKVKMIYIDPPYNTGNDFVYRDKFQVTREEFQEMTGEIDEETGDRLFRNTESNGRFHSDWCSMIYPRLLLARNLLRDDGVIFISIDDGEVAQLRKICDEVFGEGNFIGNIVWQTATDNNPRQISTEHEYIVCYSNKITSQQKWLIKSEKAEKIFIRYNQLKDMMGNNPSAIQGKLKEYINENATELDGVTHYTYVDEKGVYYPGNSSNTKPGGYTFDIIHPITKKVCRKPEFGYRWAEETFKYAAKNNDVEWGEDEKTIPKIKKRIETVTEMLKSYYYEDNRYWTKYLTSLFGKKIFENPKSANLILRLLKFTTNAIPNDIILDFFSGSATTAHAVMQLNAEDGGNRKFIMVQLPEPCEKDSEAAKAGYKNICEIGKERIRRAGERIVTSLKLQVTRGKLQEERNLETSNLKLATNHKTSNLELVTTKMEMMKYGCIKLSEADRLAEGNGTDGGNLSSGKKAAEGGDLFFVGSNEAGGSINSVKHRGGQRKANGGRISTLPANSQGVGGGIGNSTSDLRENWIPCRYGYKSGSKHTHGNKQNVDCPYENTPECPLVTYNSKLVTSNLELVTDTGFRVFKIADSNMKDVYYGAGELRQDQLDLLASNIKEDRTPLDLLYGCLLDWGLPLDMPHKEEKIGGFTVHIVNEEPEGAVLIACFDEGISEKTLTAIAKKKPLRAVFRDAGFSSDPAKINVFEIFKLHAPDTKIKVL